MNIKQLNEMPGYQDKDRNHLGIDGEDLELCSKVNLKELKYDSVIPIIRPYTIIPFHDKHYCFDEDGTIVSILQAPRTDLAKPYFKGSVVHEESIDTCKKYRSKGITTEFYYSILKGRLSILSDYEHYRGTKNLWKNLSTRDHVIIKVLKNGKMIDENYDLIKDELNVWSGPQFLLLATTSKIIKQLKIMEELKPYFIK